MCTLAVPKRFASGVLAERGEAGQQWLDALPSLVRNYLNRWCLTVDGSPMHGYLSLVLPVMRNGMPSVLKVAWPDADIEREALSLKLWNGNGAVQLLDAATADGVLLLERLCSDRTLGDIPVDDALTIAGGLLRRSAIAAPDTVMAFRNQDERLQDGLSADNSGAAIPSEYIELARSLIVQLTDATSAALVNWDLHFENVLAAEREPWLVIDPKVIIGQAEFGIAPLLWRRFDAAGGSRELERRFQLLIDSAQLGERRARVATFLRVISYWLWCVRMALTQDPLVCQALAEWLYPSVRTA